MLLVAERLNLKMASDYKCLSQSGCLAIDGVDDARKFHMLVVIIEIAITNCQEKRDGCCNHHACSQCTSFSGLLLLSLIFFFFPSSQEALDIVRICKEDQEQVFSMLAAVLWLGNISFQVMDDENHVEVLDDEGKIYVIGLAIFL